MQQATNPAVQWWETLKKKLLDFDLDNYLRQLRELFRFKSKMRIKAKVVLYIIAALASPITIAGVLLGYVRGFNKFMRPKKEWPRLENLPPIVVTAMVIGGMLIWVILIVTLKLLIDFVGPAIFDLKYVALYIAANLILSAPIFLVFRKWRSGLMELWVKERSHATAGIAGSEVWEKYSGAQPGFYIGNGLVYSEKGHLLTVASARSGKTENILAQNLLGLGGYEGSYVVLDPKGELCAICANRQRQLGKRVFVLNPWQILKGAVVGNGTYNPFDSMPDKDSPHLIDDIQLMAELICPIKKGTDSNEFFTTSARNLIASLLLYVAVTQEGPARSLTTLWDFCRKTGDAWELMLISMASNVDSINGRALRNAAKEIVAMMASPETFSSIMANVFEMTNFLKSSALQANLASGFRPSMLADGNTVVYIVPPADKLTSHAAWLRLVVTSMMRYLVRHPSKHRTCFLCDEAASLGYISEFETCLATYAGFNISLWPIYQDLSQIHALYGDKWETVMANTSAKMMFGIRSNFDARYVSEAAGDTTYVFNRKNWWGEISDIQTNHRALFTPDEVKRLSKDNMFVFISEHPVVVVKKAKYYEMPELKNEDGTNKYDRNPYIENSL